MLLFFMESPVAYPDHHFKEEEEEEEEEGGHKAKILRFPPCPRSKVANA